MSKEAKLTIRLPKEEMDALRVAAAREMVPVSYLVRHNLARLGEQWAIGKPKPHKGKGDPSHVNASVRLSSTERDALMTEAKKQMISITALIRRKLFQPEAA